MSHEIGPKEVRYECVLYHRNSKNFKDKNKNANCWDKIGQKFDLSAGEAEAKFRNIRTAYGRYRIQNRCFRRLMLRDMHARYRLHVINMHMIGH